MVYSTAQTFFPASTAYGFERTLTAIGTGSLTIYTPKDRNNITTDLADWVLGQTITEAGSYQLFMNVPLRIVPTGFTYTVY